MTSTLIMDNSIIGQAGFSTIPFVPLAWENPRMSDTKEILRTRVQERLDATSKTAHAVSKAIGANPGYVRDLLDPNKTSIPGAERLQRLALELDTTSDYLIGNAASPSPVLSEIALADRHLDWHGPDREDAGIPLVGTGDCADLEVTGPSGETYEIERSSFDPDYCIRFIERPPALRGDSSLYAIYFQGSSMEPRFFAGEVGIVQPSRPAAPGDYVLVQINDGVNGDVTGVMVKRLVRQNSREVVLLQHNPELTFRLPRSQVVRIHRIVPPTDQLLR